MDPQARSQILIHKAQAGDRQAFDGLAGRYREQLLSFVRLRLRPPLAAQVEVEDIVQETLLRAFQHLERFQWRDEGSFFRWLSGIASNVVFETASRCARAAAAPLEEETEVAGKEISRSKALAQEERFERLEGALSALSPEHRQVILLARIERRPMREVAKLMERSPEAVTQLLWRALKKLRVTFGETDSFSLPPRSLAREEDPPEKGEGR